MTDCSNAEIRDRLPDLLHDRLDASARAAVNAHVARCADCRDELELLRGVHGILIAVAPRVDVDSIVAALPKARARETRSLRPRRTWSDWRVAAAVTLLVAGGSSVAVYRHGVQASPVATPSMVAESIAHTPSMNSIAPSLGTGAAAVTRAETVAMVRPDDGTEPGLAASSAAADLNDRQLQALLDDINHLEAVPITDPDPVSLKVTPQTLAPNDGRGTE
jgi:Putative zinc-finger